MATSTVAGFIINVGSPNFNPMSAFGPSVNRGFASPASNVGNAIVAIIFAWLLAGLVYWIGSSLTIGTVTRMCVTQLASGSTTSWRDALRYALAHVGGFLFGPLVFGLMLLVLLIAEMIVLFVGLTALITWAAERRLIAELVGQMRASRRGEPGLLSPSGARP